MNEPLSMVALDALRAFEDAKNSVAPFNDPGSILGARHTLRDIEADLRDALSKVHMRSLELTLRIDKWNKGEREVGMLRERSPE